MSPEGAEFCCPFGTCLRVDLEVKFIDVVGVKHRWRAQQDYSVFVNRAIAELAGRERFALLAFDVA